MGIIGLDTSVNGNVNFTSSNVQIMSDAAAYQYTAGANEEVFLVAVRIGAYNGDGNGIEIGIYDISSGVSNATLLTSDTIGALTANQWNTQNIPSAVALTNGKIYTIAWRILSSTNISLKEQYIGENINSQSTLTGSSSLAASWTDNASGPKDHEIYAETRTAAAGANPHGPFGHPLTGAFGGPI